MRVRLYRLASGAGFVVRDEHGRALAYVYAQRERSTAQIAYALTVEEAEAVAKRIARALAVDGTQQDT